MKTVVTILILSLLTWPVALAQYQPKQVVFSGSLTPASVRYAIVNGHGGVGQALIDARIGYVFHTNVMAGISGYYRYVGLIDDDIGALGVFGRYLHPLADGRNVVFGELNLTTNKLRRFGPGVGFNHFFTERVALETSARLYLGGETESDYYYTYKTSVTTIQLGVGLLITF